MADLFPLADDQQAAADIDWAPFDAYPPGWCRCRCGRRFHSHSKTVKLAKGWQPVSRKPCPGCSRHDNVCDVRSNYEPTELVTITSADVGVLSLGQGGPGDDSLQGPRAAS